MRFVGHSRIIGRISVGIRSYVRRSASLNTRNGALLLSPFSHDAYARIPLSNAHRGLKPFMSNENEPTHFRVSCHDDVSISTTADEAREYRCCYRRPCHYVLNFSRQQFQLSILSCFLCCKVYPYILILSLVNVTGKFTRRCRFESVMCFQR